MKWYEILCFPYSEDQVGELYRDITERKKHENKLQQSEKNAQLIVEKLRIVDDNKNGFLNMFLHEIRNPMAAAMMSLSLINNLNPNSVQAIKAKDTLNRQLRHLSSLVDDLLDVTRIKTNKIKLCLQVKVFFC